jgi:hypothetical protein
MGRPSLILIVAAISAFALGAAGCSRPQTEVRTLPTGPLNQADYEHAFNVSAAGLAPKYGVGKELPKGAPAAQQAERVRALQQLLRVWAGRIAGLQPPASARRAQDRYVAGVRGFAGDLERARTLLVAGDVKGAGRLLASGRVVSARTRADLVAARRAFHALGYDLTDLDSAPVKTS